jgi:hypothetical protein
VAFKILKICLALSIITQATQAIASSPGFDVTKFNALKRALCPGDQDADKKPFYIIVVTRSGNQPLAPHDLYFIQLILSLIINDGEQKTKNIL